MKYLCKSFCGDCSGYSISNSRIQLWNFTFCNKIQFPGPSADVKIIYYRRLLLHNRSTYFKNPAHPSIFLIRSKERAPRLEWKLNRLFCCETSNVLSSSKENSDGRTPSRMFRNINSPFDGIGKTQKKIENPHLLLIKTFDSAMTNKSAVNANLHIFYRKCLIWI